MVVVPGVLVLGTIVQAGEGGCDSILTLNQQCRSLKAHCQSEFRHVPRVLQN